MAHDFNNSTTYYVRNDLFVLTDWPWSMAAWFYIGTWPMFATNQVIGVFDKDTNNIYYGIHGSSSKQRFSLLGLDGLGGVISITNTTSFSTGQWVHLAGVMRSDTDRSLWVNGVELTSATSCIYSTSCDYLTVGLRDTSTKANPPDGSLAESCFWDTDLDSEDIAALQNYSPALVRPQNILWHEHMIDPIPHGRRHPDSSIASNTNGVVAHPPIILPAIRRRSAPIIFRNQLDPAVMPLSVPSITAVRSKPITAVTMPLVVPDITTSPKYGAQAELTMPLVVPEILTSPFTLHPSPLEVPLVVPEVQTHRAAQTELPMQLVVPNVTVGKVGFTELDLSAVTDPMTVLRYGETQRYSTLWTITRTDGIILRFTDHDSPLTDDDGNTYTPTGGYSATARQREDGLRVSNVDIVGVLSDDAITNDDLRAGRYRGAVITETFVDWRYPWQGNFHSRVWRVKEYSFGGESWDIKLEGPERYFRLSFGGRATRRCRWRLGDTYCGVNLGSSPFTQGGLSVATVSSDNPRKRFTFNYTAQADDYYTDGEVVWQGGDNQALRFEIQGHSDIGSGVGEVWLWQSCPFDIQVGDQFDLIVGCDKRQSTCRDKFSNITRFGGFPWIPGPDKVIRTPSSNL